MIGKTETSVVSGIWVKYLIMFCDPVRLHETHSNLIQTCPSKEVSLMNPHPEALAPDIEQNGREIYGRIYRSNSHKNNHHAVSCKPVIDHPGPDPGDG